MALNYEGDGLQPNSYKKDFKKGASSGCMYITCDLDRGSRQRRFRMEAYGGGGAFCFFKSLTGSITNTSAGQSALQTTKAKSNLINSVFRFYILRFGTGLEKHKGRLHITYEGPKRELY